MAFISIILGLFTLDICIKGAIEAQDGKDFPKRLGGEKGKIILHKNHNPGFSFGFLQEKKHLVQMVPLAVTSAFAGVFFWLLPKKGQNMEKLALSVTLGGALSNLYDRLVRGHVIDYFSIDVKKLKKVVFNLGDLFIFLGAGMMLLTESLHSLYNLKQNIKK